MQFRINYAAVSVELTTPPPHHRQFYVHCRHTLRLSSSCSLLILYKYCLFQAQSFRPVFDSLDIHNIPAGSVRQLSETLSRVTFFHRTQAVCSGPERHVTVMLQ